MEDKIKLDIGAILDKQFDIDNRGYSPLEVDQFLDIIVHDYDAYDQLVTSLKEELADLKAENERLSAELERVNNEKSEPLSNNSQNVSSVTQLDILRRISRLEQAVFNNK